MMYTQATNALTFMQTRYLFRVPFVANSLVTLSVNKFDYDKVTDEFSSM